MYQIAYLGRWETLPETAAAIYEHDISRLEAMLQGGLDLNVPIQLSEYIKLMPLEIAVFQNDVPMIHFLLEHGADPDLAVEQPLLLTAARCCGAPGIRNCGIWTWSMRSSIPWPNGRNKAYKSLGQPIGHIGCCCPAEVWI